jgi:hypothetical protein
MPLSTFYDCLSAERKISPATAINPDAAPVIIPAVPSLAGRPASLINHTHAVACIRGAELPSPVVRRTGDHAATRHWWTRRWRRRVNDSHDKVGPAPAIDPDAAPVIAPTVSLSAGRPASLVDHAHAISRIGSTVVPIAVVGGTGKSRAISIGGSALRGQMQCAQRHKNCCE